MNLHKEITTVTSLSKIIAAVLFIILPFVGFIAGMHYQKSISEEQDETIVFGKTIVKVTPTLAMAMPADHPTWKTIEARNFSISVPPGWTYKQLQGVDSFVGEFFNGTMSLQFDYGMYSSDFSEYDRLNPKRTSVSIDALQATLFVATDEKNNGIAAVYFADTNKGIKKDDFPVQKFSMYSLDLSAQQQELALEIYKTLVFK